MYVGFVFAEISNESVATSVLKKYIVRGDLKTKYFETLYATHLCTRVYVVYIKLCYALIIIHDVTITVTV